MDTNKFAYDHKSVAFQDYRDLVDAAAQHRISLEINNRHFNHAVILTMAIFDNSRKNIDIFTNTFPNTFYSRIKSNLEDAINRNVSVRIVFVMPEKNPGGIERLLEYPKLKIFKLNDNGRFVYKKMNHFCVADNKMYRIEDLHSDDMIFDENTTVTARANFYHPPIAKKLHQFFNHIVAHSEIIKIG